MYGLCTDLTSHAAAVTSLRSLTAAPLQVLASLQQVRLPGGGAANAPNPVARDGL